MERPVDGETVFDIELKLKRTGLVEIAVDALVGRMIASRADAPHRKRTDGIGSPDIELFAIRHFGGIAVGMGYTRVHPRHKPMFA